MIRTRLTMWNAAVLAVILTLLGLVAFLSTRASLYGAVDEDLQRRAGFLASVWKNFPLKPPPIPMPKDQPSFGVDPELFRRIEFEGLIVHPCIRRVGENLVRDGEDPWDSESLKQALRGKTSLFDTTLYGHRVRILSRPLRVDGKITGAGQFAASLENADAGVARLGRVLLVLLPLALLATSTAGVWLTRRALRPVAEIADEAGRIEATNLNDRLTVPGKDEFGHLAGVFNSMLGRLEASFGSMEETNQSQRRFVADASHELKTPLTAIKTRLGVALRKEQTPERYVEHLRAVERSANTMTAIVADLLLLARSDEGQPKTGDRLLPVASLVDEAIAVVSDAYGRAIETDVEDGLLLRGDEAGFARILTNLLDNAARHTPPEGSISLLARRKGGFVRIVVSDAGCGIPADDLCHVFDRFYRVSAARDRESGGTGLGLAIVRSIVKGHGGDVEIESAVGVGTTVTVELPAAALESPPAA